MTSRVSRCVENVRKIGPCWNNAPHIGDDIDCRIGIEITIYGYGGSGVRDDQHAHTGLDPTLINNSLDLVRNVCETVPFRSIYVDSVMH